MLGFLEDPLLAIGFGALLADVADEADKELLAEQLAGGDRQLDRNFDPITVKRWNLYALVEHRPLARRQIMFEASFMRRAVNVGNDHFRQTLAFRFRKTPAESCLGMIVPADHHTIDIHHHDRIERGVEHGLKTGMKAPPRHVHAAPLAYFSSNSSCFETILFCGRNGQWRAPVRR